MAWFAGFAENFVYLLVGLLFAFFGSSLIDATAVRYFVGGMGVLLVAGEGAPRAQPAGGPNSLRPGNGGAVHSTGGRQHTGRPVAEMTRRPWWARWLVGRTGRLGTRLYLRREWPAVLLIALMFVASALLWPSAPERVPAHWGLPGEPDEDGPKAVRLLVIRGADRLPFHAMRAVHGCEPLRPRPFPIPFPVLRAATVALLAVIHAFALLWIFG